MHNIPDSKTLNEVTPGEAEGVGGGGGGRREGRKDSPILFIKSLL